MKTQIRPLRSSVLLLALLVPACDGIEETSDTDDSSDTDDTDGTDPLAIETTPTGNEMAAPLRGSKAELDALADRGVITRSTPRSIELAERSHAERLRIAEQRIRAADQREPGRRLAAMITPARGVERTHDGNYRVKIRDAELGEREIITMGPATTTLDLAAALDGLDDPANQLAAYRALHEKIDPSRHPHLRVVSPESLASARPAEIRAEIERLAEHPDLPGSLDALALAPAPRTPPLPTADNTENTCNPSAATGVIANFSFPLKPNLSTIKNQGNRGSCTAFAVTSAVETARSVGGGGLANYSEQDLYYRAKAQWSGLTNYGDGLDAATTLNLAASHSYRFANESAWPYNPSYSRLDFDPAPVYVSSCTGYAFSLGGVIGNYCSDTVHQGGQLCVAGTCFYSSPVGTGTGSRVSGNFDLPVNIPIIKTYLGLKQSMVLSFNVTDSFTDPTTGGYVNAFAFEPTIGAHAVHLVGTIDNAQLAITRPGAPAGGGGGYVILKNSWGSCYGDGGFVYMSYSTLAAFGYAVRVTSVVN